MIMIIKPLIYLGLAAISSVSFVFSRRSVLRPALRNQVLRFCEVSNSDCTLSAYQLNIRRLIGQLSEYRGDLRNWSLRTWDGST